MAATKAPSPLYFHALHRIAFPNSGPRSCLAPISLPRYYANSSPAKKSSKEDSPPPPKTTTPKAPPKPSSATPPRPLPRHYSEPDFSTRYKDDDDAEFTPVPLSRPIGMPEPPLEGDNMGLDSRSLREKRADFVDYDKHLAKRAKMKKQFARPYFRDWSNLRFHKGKIFIAPERLFRAEHALFFPNFFGRTLRKGMKKVWKQDGYGGLGRDTCKVMQGKISVVSLVTSAWAFNQVRTFVSAEHNPGLQTLIKASGDLVQQVEIDREDNVLKYWILRLFGMPSLRRERTPEEQERYFVVRRGVSEQMKEALGLLNESAGYVYLVDPECRVRWAGSAIAQPRERESLLRGVRKLMQEASGEREERKEKLESAVKEAMVEHVENKPAAAA